MPATLSRCVPDQARVPERFGLADFISKCQALWLGSPGSYSTYRGN
jgi:hypothetical protein